MNIIILAAGQGKRFYSKDIPKCLMPIGQQTVLERLLCQIQACKPQSKVKIVVGFQKEKIIKHLHSLKNISNIFIQWIVNDSYQTDTNGGSLLLALNEFVDTYVFEGDCVYEDRIISNILNSNPTSSTIYLKGSADKNKLNGVIQLSSNLDVKQFVIGTKEKIVDIESYYNMIGVLWIPQSKINEVKKELKNQYYFIPFVSKILSTGHLLPEYYKMTTFNTQCEYFKTLQMFGFNNNINLEPIENLKHIENFSIIRVNNLLKKIQKSGIWNKPICVDRKYKLIMDGQHRYEVAKKMNLKEIPVIYFDYNDTALKIYSLRPTINFTKNDVVQQSLKGLIYPYKTVKHIFPNKIPKCYIKIEELK